jgi:beta-galactosidase
VEKLAGVEVVFSYPVTGTGAVGEAFGIEAPLAGWCSALRPISAAGGKPMGALQSVVAPGLAFLTERRVGDGAVVVMAAAPEGEAGRQLILAIVEHYATQAGVKTRARVSRGTLVCPRKCEDGRELWITVNLDGKGGTLDLPRAAKDTLRRESLAPGTLELSPYEWRALEFPG